MRSDGTASKRFSAIGPSRSGQRAISPRVRTSWSRDPRVAARTPAQASAVSPSATSISAAKRAGEGVGGRAPDSRRHDRRESARRVLEEEVAVGDAPVEHRTPTYRV